MNSATPFSSSERRFAGPKEQNRSGSRWSHPPGLNRRPADYESAALPAELGWLCLQDDLRVQFNIPTEVLAQGQLLGLVRRSDLLSVQPRWRRKQPLVDQPS